MNWWREFWAWDNSRMNTAAAMALPIYLIGLAAFCYYAFWLGRDIGVNNKALLLGLLAAGGGGYVASLVRKPGNSPDKEAKGD